MEELLKIGVGAAYLQYGIYERWLVRCVVDAGKLTLVLVKPRHVRFDGAIISLTRQTPFSGESPIFVDQYVEKYEWSMS